MADKITVTADPIPGTTTFAITATLTDDAGQPNPGQKISFKVDPASRGRVDPKEADTDAAGTASTTLTPKAGVAALSIIAQSAAAEDRKEISIMSELEDKQKALVEAKQKLQEQLALAAKLEQDVQKLQEAEQLRAKAALNAQAEQYAKEFKNLELTQRVTDLDSALKRLADKVKPNAEEAKIKQVEERRAKVEADRKARQTQVDKLKQESDQLAKDVATAEADLKNRTDELEGKKNALAELDKALKALADKVAKSSANFDKDNKANVLQTWCAVLDHKAEFDTKIKPKLVTPDDLRKDLETKQKALGEANEKLRQLQLKQAEKLAELQQATAALSDIDPDAVIKEFIALITA